MRQRVSVRSLAARLDGNRMLTALRDTVASQAARMKLGGSVDMVSMSLRVTTICRRDEDGCQALAKRGGRRHAPSARAQERGPGERTCDLRGSA